MKKLLAMVLVLGLASVASAGLTWSVDSLTLNVGETATVQLIASADMNDWSNVAFASSSDLGVASFASVTPLAALGNAGTASILGEGYPEAYQGLAMFESNVSASAMDSIDAGAWVDLVVVGVAQGTATLSSDYTSAFGAADSLAVTVVPEPLTMSLIGLGGLALIRRRRA